jgi:two-component system cell cycle sensor histidine kinase PleC
LAERRWHRWPDHSAAAGAPEIAVVSAGARAHPAATAAILDSIDHGLAAFDAADRLIAFNRHFPDFFRLPRASLGLGMSLAEVASLPGGAEDAVAWRPDLLQRLPGDPRPIEVRDDNGRALMFAAAPLSGGGLVLTCHDITSRVAAEEALRESEARLQDRVRALETAQDNLKALARDLAVARDAAEQANRVKSDFLAYMSHELRTPLNAIIGFSDIMRQELFGPISNPAYVRYSEDICSSGGHLLEIINDILDLSKVEAGKLQLKIAPVDVAGAIRACASVVRGRAHQGGLILDVSCPPLPNLLVDELKLKQVLLNLLSNAIKFTPEGGRVAIGARMTEDQGMAIEVTDTGVGMTEEQLVAAVLPFSQIENPFCRKQEGTGLGLPLAKSLAEANGGVLHLSSVPDRGTTARVSFPASCLSR